MTKRTRAITKYVWEPPVGSEESFVNPRLSYVLDPTEEHRQALLTHLRAKRLRAKRTIAQEIAALEG